MRPTLALHSSGLGPWQWKYLQGEVIAPELVRDTFLEDLADVVALLRQQKTPVHLVGHSYGAFLALKAAVEAPEHVRTLFAYEPVAYGVLEASERADLDALKRQAWFRDPATGGDERWLRQFVDYWSGEGAWDAMHHTAQDSFRSQGRRVFGEVMSLNEDTTPLQRYVDTLRMPAVLMSGTTSPLSARRVAQKIGEGLSSGQYVKVSGAGHMGPISHKREVHAAIMALSRL